MKKITLLVGCALLQFQLANAQTTTTFNYTGGVQTYTVPACVTSITVDVQGAQGGLGGVGCNGYQGQPGLGGRVQATIPVNPGDVLNIYVGGAGAPDNNSSAAGGFNGGGNAMLEPMYTYYGGGGGGGASDIRLNGNALTDRIVVAGGGGGAGSDGCNCGGLDGGHGGGLVANNGNPGAICICDASGHGGDQLTGGIKGDWGCNCNAQPGSLGQGGDSNSSSCGGPTGGGGGGGGYYGGGGGGLGAGGGGSSYTIPSATGVVHTIGYRSGDGVVIITTSGGGPNPGPITGSINLCQNTSGNYSIASLVNALSYTWTVPPGTVINSGQGTTSINVTGGSISGNISVTATYACGTSGPSNLNVTMNPAPTIAIAVSPSSTVCAGTNVTLTASGATTYSWSGGISNGVPFVANTTTTYTVTATDANGCVATATQTITANNTVSVTVTSNPSSTVCAGSSVTLTGSGASTYSWSGGVTDGVPFVPTATTTYTVTGTDVNGCTGTSTQTVTVNPLPIIGSTASPASTVCAGSSVTLNGTGATSYAWSGGVTDGVPFVPTSTTTYTVTGTDANGCVNTATSTITVNPLPVVGSTAFPSATVCSGSSVTLSGTGATSYAWSGGVTNGIPFTPISTTTYTVTGTNANGCVNTATVLVTVNPLPNVTANSTSTNALCGADTVTLTGGGASTYTWSGGVTNGVPFVANSTATYTVTGTNANGCSNTAMVTVVVNGLPVVTASASDVDVCLTDANVTLTGTPAGGTWSGPGITGNSFNPMAATTGVHALYYTYTDANGCTNSAFVNVAVNVCAGVEETSLANGVIVYPNPNNGTFTISVDANVGDMKIELMDMQGRVVFSSMENNVQAGFSKQVSIENVSNGIYMLRLTTNGEQKIEKISVQK